MREFAEWLSGTAPSVAIHSTFWLIRLLQAVHLLTGGVACVSGLMIALRVLGWQRRDQPFDTVWRRFAPWLATSLAVMVLTGIAQTLGDPVREFTATSYLLKLALVLGCIVGTLLLARAGRRLRASGFSLAARLLAMGLIVFWLAIPLLGRMIAYDRPFWGQPVAAPMNTQSILEGIQGSALADWMRYTDRAMPVVEATHVLAALLLFGTVLMVDLRLLGLVDSSRSVTRLTRETLPLTWSAFGISVITGSLMFTTSAQTYFANTAFQLKALALLGAGLNMLLFQLFMARGMAAWDQDLPVPRAARTAGLLSLLLWAAVVLLGRWIGFTKGYDFTIPPGVDFVFP